MAQNFLSINRGQAGGTPGNVLVATSAPTADMYLQILTTHNPTREDVLLALDNFRMYILSNGIPGGETGVDLPPL
jgi:hypothetical protein